MGCFIFCVVKIMGDVVPLQQKLSNFSGIQPMIKPIRVT